MSLDFVALDVETANADRGSICSFGLAMVQNGVVVETVNWLTRPPEGNDFFDEFNVNLHGISAASVRNEPPFAERMAQVLDKVGELPVIAHNAAFDMGAIREACDWENLDWPTLTYGCTLVMARRALSLISYRLPVVCDALGVSLESHHKAEADAIACAEVLVALARANESTTIEALAQQLKVELGQMQNDRWRGCRSIASKTLRHAYTHKPSSETPPPNESASQDNPLYGQTIVFTGRLSIERETHAWPLAAQCGAIVAKGVTRKTSILVIRDGFSGNDPAEFSTGKAAKAAALRAQGQEIEIWTEREFYEAVGELADQLQIQKQASQSTSGWNLKQTAADATFDGVTVRRTRWGLSIEI